MNKVDVTALEDGQYEITLKIDAKILNVDDSRVQSEGVLSQMIDIGLFSTDLSDKDVETKPLYLKKHLIKTGENTVKLIVSEKPNFAGIDPYFNLIDRDYNDNVKAL